MIDEKPKSVIFLTYVQICRKLRSVRFLIHGTPKAVSFLIYQKRKAILLWFVGAGITVTLFSLIWFVPQYQAQKARERVTAAINNLNPSDQPKERLQLEKDLTTAENSARTTIAQILGGLVLLSGLYFTYRNLRVTEEGKLTDRFSKAIELLGNDKLDIRLGGIYALERLARDSKNDHWAIMEVLTAYVREHSRREETKADIQAILEVIFRRKWIASEPQSLFLSGADLSGANLSGADLRRIILSKAKLRKADLNFAELSNTDLFEADLSEADLRGAKLEGAKLEGAKLEGAKLEGADLSEADLRRATLSGANLSGANLSRADLEGADLSTANLIRANLEGTDLRRAKLIGGRLNWATLSGANLREANLEEASLFRANLFRANLEGANLRKADLEGAYLSETDIRGADLSEATLYRTIFEGPELSEAKKSNGETSITGFH